MKLVDQLTSNYSEAQNSTTWARTAFKNTTVSTVESLESSCIGTTALPKRAIESPIRSEFFFGSIPDDQILGKLLSGSNSAVVTTFDLPYVKKVGYQGYTFPEAYVWKKAVSAYFQPSIYHDETVAPPVWMAQALSYVGRELLEAVGELKPLSWPEAVDATCKNTACHPWGGDKSDPDNRARLLAVGPDAMPYEASALVGQRYQRNKQDENGYPIPRAIFNMDIVSVARAKRFTAPLIAAIQEWALEDPMCPYSELNGPNSVGRSIAAWHSRKTIHWTALMGDVSGMDTCFRLAHAKWVYDFVLGPVFKHVPGLWESIKTCFTCKVAIDDRHVVSGSHSLLSGVDWTHMIEEFLSAAIDIATANTVVMESATEIGATAFRFKEPLRLVCGDDRALLIAHPKDWTVACDPSILDPSYPTSATLLEAATCISNAIGMKAHLSKQGVFDNAVSFCSKTYAVNNATTDDRGRCTFMHPVYSPVLAYNSIRYPESGDAATTPLDCLIRFCQIADQCAKHPKFNILMDLAVAGMTEEARGALADLICGDYADLVSAAKYHRDTWVTYIDEWVPSQSPSLAALTAFVARTSPEALATRSVECDLQTVRAILWLYAITPEESTKFIHACYSGSATDVEWLAKHVTSRSRADYVPSLPTDGIATCDNPLEDARVRKAMKKLASTTQGSAIAPRLPKAGKRFF